MRTTGLAIILFSAAALAACGGDDDGVTPIDSGTDAPTDGPPVTCTVSNTNFPGLGTLSGRAIIDTGMNAGDASDDLLEFDALLETTQPSDLLSIQLYGGYGVFGTGPVTTGTFQISGVETNFATCGVCIALLTNATQTGFEDTYFATGGTLTVTAVGTAVGQTFAASFSGLTFTHVTIDDTTLETTPVGDGCDSAIASGDFSADLAAPN